MDNLMSDTNFVSIKPAVEFIGIQDQYCFNENLLVKFKFNDYTPQEGDRIAIFKLGWSFVKDYVVFEWAPIDSHKENAVLFSRHILPKNATDIFQMCYVSCENELHGASSPFQFTAEESMNISAQSVTLSCTSSTELKKKPVLVSLDYEKDREISRLKEENAILKESLKALISQKNCTVQKCYDRDIQELRDVTESLKSGLAFQQKEINILKLKIKEGGEEYKKLYIEKAKVERKYEKLKSKKDAEVSSSLSVIDDFDVGEIKSIPPFPFNK